MNRKTRLVISMRDPRDKLGNQGVLEDIEHSGGISDVLWKRKLYDGVSKCQEKGERKSAYIRPGRP